MPRLQKPVCTHPTLDFDTPTQAERDATAQSYRDIFWHSRDAFLANRANPCLSPCCGTMPVSLSYDYGLDHEPHATGLYSFRSYQRITLRLGCACGRSWALPDGWQIVVYPYCVAMPVDATLLMSIDGISYYAVPPVYIPATYESTYTDVNDSVVMTFNDFNLTFDRIRDTILSNRVR